MKKLSLIIVLAFLVLITSAQNVLTISERKISLDEFKSVFFKNNYSKEITKEYLDEYMDLFVNFKLKVIEAQELGLDTNQSFIQELEGYRKQLAKPYLRNKDFDKKMFKIPFLDCGQTHIYNASIDPRLCMHYIKMPKEHKTFN